MIKNKISYINSGNYFSKSFFLQKENKENKILLITETNKDIENYEKIMSFLNMDFRKINTYEILNNFISPHLASPLGERDFIYLVSLENLENISLNKNQFDYFSLSLEKAKTYNFEEITKKLIDLNFKFSEYKNSGTFLRAGDILNITSSDSKINYEISFWGNEIEEINVNGKITEKINIFSNIYFEESKEKNIKNFLEIIKNNQNLIILDNLNFSKYYDILLKNLENFSAFDYIANKNLKIIDLEISIPKIENTGELKNILQKENNIIIYTKKPKIIQNFIEYNSIKNTKVIETNLNNIKSFKIAKNLGTGTQIVICNDILSKIFTKKRIKKNLSADLDLLLKIKPGDYVVHIEHGIGIFKEIVKREISGKIKEYIEIRYAGEDKLFVPITEVSRVNKYLGVENPKLTSLGGNSWEKKLEKAKQEASEIAQELIEIYAERKLQKGFMFIEDKQKEQNFRDSFSYVHTPDQFETIKDILQDMSKPNPMDRLVVGDVGFGKTEIAFNAIYRAFLNKKQSILIVPLVVLAYEHFEKAKDRFKEFGVKIGILTRLEPEKKASETIRKLSTGELDLVIGTHKLLSDKVSYKDLGLIVTDEEHKFGVADKEKIKEFKTSIDSLAMSATPIPRSLNMALSNIIQISILKTPPNGRQNIDTIINRFSDEIIKQAGELEFNRNGQMFFVHNRVASIENIRKILQNIFPEKRIIITHGQLPGLELEKRIIAFKNKKYDILLSTTVIENGIDFSNVNTIIINNAEQFGLSQIHQLRGRVGRSDKKGYCHLLYKQETIKPETAKRLKTLAEYSYVGAGFELAMKDLEIRGGGDLLGFRQSGQSSSIGINLYLKIIEEKIEELKLGTGTKRNIEINTKIDLDIDIFIPEIFFNSELDKINFYREIELINDLEELYDIKKEFTGNVRNADLHSLHNGIENLFDLLELKLIAKKYYITNIKKIGINYQIDFSPHLASSKGRGIENLKKFLDLDKQVKFVVKDLTTLRTPAKSFANPKKFLKYILSLFKGQNLNSKIKLIGKK